VAPANEIVAENCLAGNPKSEWDITGAGDTSIQGFATDMSIDQGQVVRFKVKTDSSNYRLDIYRIGYYGGNGARKITTVEPSAVLPQTQPTCQTAAATGLIDCGNWSESASWTVPANAASGIYIAKLVREDGPNVGKASHIIFIVRDDDGASDLLFQTADTTWQAYNDYGGNSLYVGAPAGRAYKVSYNRPFNTRGNQYSRAWFFANEYPMVRWLEANGYDISYFSGVDSDRRGGEINEHQVFLSVGHDEYWSAGQRTNVEQARNAGVHLAFFSGNEVFWKTRWENSIDGSNTPYRTLVSYKETHANAKIDPSSTWTGSWRDPRFSPPADGGRPENALTGTIFTVNCCRSDTITVPEADGKMRFWRHTSVATLSSGQSATLATGTLGYEWDEDLDNGSRPNGLIRLSSTTVSGVSYLQDYGSTYASGTGTHHLTLYRHSSGALVFGSGTVRWSWGLDGNHDDGTSTPDVRMQQATVNLFADMEVQPANIQPGLIAATISIDTTAPTSSISAPAANTTVTAFQPVTISGTAADTGGVVGGVEVSVDNGVTWRAATGRSSWSYTWTPSQTGQITIKSRATDDSGRIETPSAGKVVTVSQGTCPCTIWPNSATPTNPSVNDGVPIEVGIKFRASQNGYITGVRFYKGSGNTGTHVGHLWSSTGTMLAEATFTGESASGWQSVTFTQPIAVTANTTYVASYHSPSGGFASDVGYFSSSVDTPPLRALRNSEDGPNAVYKYGASGFPSQSYNASNYWVDVIFNTTTNDTTPPTVTSTTPASGATNVSRGASVQATFSEAVDPNTISTSTFELRDASNQLVPAAVTYNSTTRIATLQPNSLLAASATFTARLRGGSTSPRITDVSGNALASDYTWSFTTAASTACPCTIWAASATPGIVSANDPNAVELGVKFRAREAGYITGLRFYKGSANTGPHIAHLWSSSGTLLAEATFSNESASGWQQVDFPAPVAITANTTYIAAYHTSVGNFAVDLNYFTSAVDRPPLTALANGQDGANGVFKYGVSGFPTQTYSASNYWVDVVFNSTASDTTAPTVTSTNPASGANNAAIGSSVQATFSEGMDANTISSSTFELRTSGGQLIAASVSYNASTRIATLQPSSPLATATTYTARLRGGSTSPRITDLAGNPLASDVTWSFSTVSSDTTPPTVTSTTPSSGATNVATGTSINATFSEAIDQSTVSGSTFELRDSGNQVIAATVTYNSSTKTATLQPNAALAPSTTYTARLRGGSTSPRITDLAGNPLASDATWSFTTAAPASCPCTIWTPSTVPGTASWDDPNAIEVGVKFRASKNGYITGVRFYKGSGNTGTHVGHLWSNSGQMLAEATFTGESASGWQQANFTSPVAVSANTTYVASYSAPVGGYAADSRYFSTSGVSTPPLQALADGVDGGNGVYRYGANIFPDLSYFAANYWVDVVFTETTPNSAATNADTSLLSRDTALVEAAQKANPKDNKDKKVDTVAPSNQQSIEGDQIKLQFARKVGKNWIVYRPENVPTGLKVNPNTGLIHGKIDFTAAQEYGGRYRVKLTAPDGSVEYITWTVANTNRQPDLENIKLPNKVQEGVLWTFTAKASDPDGMIDPLTFSLINAPEGATIDPVTGLFTWKPRYDQHGPEHHSKYRFTIRVQDTGNPALIDEQTVQIMVE
jgi:methionine-rich copper-binding protein CopC